MAIEAPYTIIEAIRTIRSERNWPLRPATQAAVEHFDVMGWEVPDSIRSIANRGKVGKVEDKKVHTF